MSQSRVELEKPWGNGRIVWTRDAAADDSDKTFTVPAGKVWWIQSLEMFLVTSATVGNRVMQVTITNGAANIWTSRPAGALAAGAIGSYYITNTQEDANARRDLSNDGQSSTVVQSDIWPAMMLLPAASVIRVRDYAAIDAAADDMTIVLYYIEYDA